MSSLYGKGRRGKATRLHSQVVRQRGRCEAAGYNNLDCSQRLECAHIIGRRYAATRCDPANAYALCGAHHRYFTEWPVEFNRFVVATIGADAYDDLRAAAMRGPVNTDGVKVSSSSDAQWWQDWIDVLEPMLEVV